MSSDRPPGAPSQAAEARRIEAPPEGLSARGEAARVRVRGFALLDALERHSAGSMEHADATGAYAFATAVELGASRDQAELTREAARLHDVGRVYAPVEVLTAPAENLSEEERAALDSHHEAGASLARGADISEEVCGWILNSRERFDGGGPARLRAEDVPAEARIIRAACACDRLLSWHAEAGAGDPVAATVEALRAAGGRELDPRAVEALAGVLERATAGAAENPAAETRDA